MKIFMSKNCEGVFPFRALWSIDVDTVNYENNLKLSHAQFFLLLFCVMT